METGLSHHRGSDDRAADQGGVTEAASEPTGARDIVFFDGDCGFCHGRVRWLRARDRDGRLDFAPLSGELAARVLRGTGLAAGADESPNTMVLVRAPLLDPPEICVKSRAVAAAAAHLPFPWRLGGLIALIPRPLADAAYDWVARRRRSWHGTAACPLPARGV